MTAAPGLDAEEAEQTLSEEDRARADLYAVLARLWYAAPDQALLDALAQNGAAPEGAGNAGTGDDTELTKAWAALSRAAASADPRALNHEYDDLFVGTGRSEITLYCSHYMVETGHERIVIAVRDQLRELGLQRAGGSHEAEDHLAALLEVMRHLIVQCKSDSEIDLQSNFFSGYIKSCYVSLTETVLRSEGVDFYKHVARLTRAFLDVESRSFDMI
jgi:TorA maturation chaperone TorD